MSSGLYTCITCRVGFRDGDLQRAHYKTDWHRYNLKRKVADLPPVTTEVFKEKVLSQRAKVEEEQTVQSLVCQLCSKHFSSENAYQNHIRSKKHKELSMKAQQQSNKTSDQQNSEESSQRQKDYINKKIKTDMEKAQKLSEEATSHMEEESKQNNKELQIQNTQGAELSCHSEPLSRMSEQSSPRDCWDCWVCFLEQSKSSPIAVPEQSHSGPRAVPKQSRRLLSGTALVSDSEEEEWEGDALGMEECLFCPSISSSLENNINHMSVKHGFFLPDADYLVDLEGMITYLGEKVGEGHMCLWCGEKGRTFRSLQAVQKHMVDKGHCKIFFEKEAALEFADFYDYRSSYPDSKDNAMETGEEEEELSENVLDTEGFEMILPSGATIGHRSLWRYYKQNLPQRSSEESSKVLPKMLAQYRALGWTGASGDVSQTRVKDLAYMQRMKNRQHIKLGMKANKFQPHFRCQVMF